MRVTPLGNYTNPMSDAVSCLGADILLEPFLTSLTTRF